MKIKKTLMIILCFLIFSSTSVFAATKSNAISPYYYVFNNKDLLTRTEVDEISNIGEILSLKGYELIFNINQNSSNDHESKDIFYNYLKNIDNTKNEKKIIVFSYYTNTNSLQMYDDYGIIPNSILEDLETKFKKYSDAGNIGKGSIYAYSTLAKYINKSQKLGIISINDLKIDDTYSTNAILSLKNVFILIAIVILLIGFRRNKNIEIKNT